ncbi:phosphomannomutase [Palleronia caenipelagi]|uniref:Phosphomannomutase n=1 Tax=Palleronia caenipelagi TaxID=2489174 RepID=A0A547Q770_9RHOB|nr:phosphomannomutase [Palleronia caenipelagi]TRD22203.1 phosphomannomutase [Palleronia caenipelagi]
MAPKFGTSGLRGLVTELTEPLVAAHVRAFLTACDTGGAVYIGGDLRPSTAALMETVSRTVTGMGARAVLCGTVPTPALALVAREAKASAIMVTGSHIPADRNGLKFYSRAGEITKDDEAAITAALDTAPGSGGGTTTRDTRVAARYRARYATAFGEALNGQRIGLYAHSAVGRDLLAEILLDAGAEVVELGRADHFIPIDTEAISGELRCQLRDWAAGGRFNAIVSTDGDSDRPLITDVAGTVIPGDLLGQITAELLGAHSVVTPISSNPGVAQKGFAELLLTRIGSPFVIAGMETAQGPALGYEANGGTLLGFDAQGPAGPLPALPTRDAVLPILAVLTASEGDVAARVRREPPVFTAADRLTDIDREGADPLLKQLDRDPTPLLAPGETVASCDHTDGPRWTLSDGAVLQLRPSGNAPELRIYTVADTPEAAAALLDRTRARMQDLLT